MLAILTTHPIQYQIPLWQALAKDGSIPFEVWYLTAHGTHPSHDEEFGKSFAWDLDMLSGYPYRFLRVNRDAKLSRFEKLRLEEPLGKLFRENKVTALWVQGWQVLAYWQAVWQARAAGIPVWLRGESNDLAPISAGKKIVKRLLLSQLFQRIDHFLYIGKGNRRLYQNYGVRPEQLHPAPYCVDNDRFAEQAKILLPQRAAIRRAWNIPDEAFCILFAGKFISKKRPLDLVRAAGDARLKRCDRPLHLLWVGSGELGAELRDACHVVFDAENPSLLLTKPTFSASANQPPASFTGFLNQTEISKAYIAADCLVLPSDFGETWGLVVNEALASGLPCVISQACGCSEDLILPLNSSFCFQMGDRDALASALLSLLDRPPSPDALREQVSKYSIQDSIVAVRQLYQSTISSTCATSASLP